MSNGDLNWIANFIWGIADDVLRDLFVRGKYRDVILPMCVIRRLDAVLEPTKKAVLDMKKNARRGRHHRTGAALCAGRRPSVLQYLDSSRCAICKSRGSQQQLEADFEAYLDGFSPNVQDILDNFKFRNQIPTLFRSRRARHADRQVPRPDQPQSEAGLDADGT